LYKPSQSHSSLHDLRLLGSFTVAGMSYTSVVTARTENVNSSGRDGGIVDFVSTGGTGESIQSEVDLRMALQRAQAQLSTAKVQLVGAQTAAAQAADEAQKATRMKQQIFVLKQKLSASNSELEKVQRDSLTKQRQAGSAVAKLDRALRRSEEDAGRLIFERDELLHDLEVSAQKQKASEQHVARLREEKCELEKQVSERSGLIGAKEREAAEEAEALRAATAALLEEQQQAESDLFLARQREKEARLAEAAVLEESRANREAQAEKWEAERSKLETSMAEKEQAAAEADKLSAAALREIEEWQRGKEEADRLAKDFEKRAAAASKAERSAKSKASRWEQELDDATQKLNQAREERDSLLAQGSTQRRRTAMFLWAALAFIVLAQVWMMISPQ